MKKWYQKSMAVLTAAACLFAGGTIGLARDSLPQLQLTAEAANTYIGAAYGLQLEYEELNDGTVEITRFVSATSTDIELPSMIDGKPVTSIGKSAFDVDVVGACRNLTSIIIPDSVTSIGNYAFESCTSLTNVTIPNSVTSIGYDAFYNCTGLTDIIIPDSVTSIGAYTFYNCTGLTSVTIPDSVTSIGDFAFYDCTSLTDVTIPDSVTSIGDNAFHKCTSLTNVTIPDSVTSIGDYAFYHCTGLTSVTIPDSVTSIGDYAFDYCTGLTSVTIPGSVTSIGNYAFYKCTSLTDVTIPNGVTSIGDNAFCDCDNLTDIYYKGTEAKWNQISIGSSAIPSDVTIHYAPIIGNLEIAQVEITLDELQANDYEVTVPVTINNNDDGWDALAFGLSWDTNEVTYFSNIRGNLINDAYTNQNIKIDSSGLQISPDASC